MRRLMAITAFALFLAVPLCAQHGGGHGGGGHASFGGGHSSGFSGHASFGGGHSRSIGGRGFAHTPSFSHRSFSHGPIITNGSHGHFHNHGFRNNCFGFACRGYGYPWWGWGYYDPWWWDSSSSYDDDYNRNLAIANQMNEQSLEQQRMMRQEEADGDQDLYTQRSTRPPATPNAARNDDKQGSALYSPTVLVFRDQHQQEIQNYAIVGQTLWNFAPGHTQKIPLSSLDLAATEKANDDRGVRFQVPAANEAQ